MKHIIITIICCTLYNVCSAQINQYDRPSYSPFSLPSFNEMAAQAEMMAKARAKALEKYNYYLNLANQAYDRSDYSAFLGYSSQALSTGFFNSELYFKRGLAFVSINNISAAKQEFKIAKKHGHPQADMALKQLRKRRK